MVATAYPWGALEPVSRSATRVSLAARQATEASLPVLARALGELLELPAELYVKQVLLGRVPALGQLVWLCGSGLSVGVLADPALASYLAARVLRRAEPLADPREPLSAPLAGLLAALVTETARRAGVALSLLGAPPVGEEALLVDTTTVLDGRPFLLTCYVVGASTAHGAEPTLAQLGELTLRVPLVIASIALERRDLLSLEVGGALMPAEGEPLPLTGPTRAVLVAPQSERGIAVELRPDGRLVVGETTQARLTLERDPESSTDGETLTDVLLDTPVVVRVELGAVSMSAREWARLGPGDVVETAQRIAEPVVLRVAGREVGRGELVNVDGQIGVRIQKLYEDK
jgi:flagellar motor switch/type III secretory pathway protein FliN